MTAPQPTSISPTQPAAPYIGGKRNLAKRIVSRINDTPHTLYAEPFVGMGGVLPTPSPVVTRSRTAFFLTVASERCVSRFLTNTMIYKMS